MPCWRASSTARLDGAPTAASTGMPATAAFCTSSKLARPLTSRMPSWRGVRPARNAAPMSLSRALCRPTSSRRSISPPPGSNRAAACRPPVRSKTPCAARRDCGSEWMTSASTRGRPAIGAARGSNPHGLQRRLAADAAARGRIEVTLEATQVHLDARLQLDAHHIATAPVLDRRHLFGVVDDPLGEQESDGQLVVVAGSAHRDRDTPADPAALVIAGQADLQRLLHGQVVRLHGRVGAGDAPHQHGRDGRVVRDVGFTGALHGRMIPGRGVGLVTVGLSWIIVPCGSNGQVRPFRAHGASSGNSRERIVKSPGTV